MSTDTGTGAQSRLDLTMMYVVHDAFRRDMALLVAAAATRTGSLRAFKEGWTTFTYYLAIHHTAEDTHLWPPIRRKAGADAERTALLDAMESEHAVLDPIVAAVNAQLAAGDIGRVRESAGELSTALTAHLEHEEVKGLPLVDAVLTSKEWEDFGEEQRNQVGIKGAAQFFPWLLDGMPESTERKVLALVPPPIRFLYRKQWRPRYHKRSPWGQASRA
jgi:hypothetical protein